MFAARGIRYEFKVEHGTGGEMETKKFVKFFVKEQEMKAFTPDMLIQQLKDKCKITDISNIKYMDHDRDWIDLRCYDFESFVDMVESAEVIADREDILRITLKVSGNPGSSLLSQSCEVASKSKRMYSPSPGKQNISKKRTRIKPNLNSESDYEDDEVAGTALDDIDQLEQDEARDEADARETVRNDYVSPTQKFFAKLELNEQRLLTLVRKQEIAISQLVQSFEKPKNSPKVPLCTNCHKPGHNKSHCVFVPCVSATLCNEIKRHPDEMKYLKEKRDELKVSKGKLAKVQDELKSKKEMLSGVQDTFVAKVQSDLINSNPEKYLRKAICGQVVPNWLLVNSDIRKLERVCHGKLPLKHEIQPMLQMYDDRFDILSKTNAGSESDYEHVNPVKQLWEKKGIRFPGRGSVPNSTSCSIPSQNVSVGDDIIETPTSSATQYHLGEPKSKREEDYLLQIGLSQSLETKQPEIIVYCNESDDKRAESEGEDICGLDMLFEAAKILEK